MYHRNKAKYFSKKNTYYRPWGKYTNLFNGNNFKNVPPITLIFRLKKKLGV